MLRYNLISSIKRDGIFWMWAFGFQSVLVWVGLDWFERKLWFDKRYLYRNVFDLIWFVTYHIFWLWKFCTGSMECLSCVKQFILQWNSKTTRYGLVCILSSLLPYLLLSVTITNSFFFWRAPSVFSILLLLLRDASNFKIRIQAAAALAVPVTPLG